MCFISDFQDEQRQMILLESFLPDLQFDDKLVDNSNEQIFRHEHLVLYIL